MRKDLEYEYKGQFLSLYLIFLWSPKIPDSLGMEMYISLLASCMSFFNTVTGSDT